jgi:ABC-type sugar transport system ATPase subunit
VSFLDLVHIEKRIGDTEILRGIDLGIEEGEFVVLLGASGCGKSTLLRLIAGLDEPSRGEIRIAGRDVTHTPPRDRGVAMVFQSYALYPHMTVAENLRFALELKKMASAEITRRVTEVATMLAIEPLLGRLPKQLSGGQRQRVAIGRALVRKPRVFLFDEPLSNLDAKLRTHMRLELKQLHQRLGRTTVYVTHDQVEAMSLGQRICIMRSGLIEQVGTPADVYLRPRTQYVASFVGQPEMNFVPAEVRDGGVWVGAERWLTSDARPGPVILGLRPNELSLANSGGPAITVELIEELGATRIAHVRAGKHTLRLQLTRDQTSQGTALVIAAGTSYLFDATSGLAL